MAGMIKAAISNPGPVNTLQRYAAVVTRHAEDA
jgi:hypothetical protein